MRLLYGHVMMAGVAFLCCWSGSKADELDTLPQAPSVPSPPASVSQGPSNNTSQSRMVLIKSVIPPYIDKGVIMLPMRPLCDFLGLATSYHDSIISISNNGLASADGRSVGITVTLRAGGQTAQVQKGAELKSVRLPLSAEERLGTIFLPLHFVTETFGAQVLPGRNNAILIQSGERIGEFQAIALAPYRGGDAARITIVNYVGRPLSIRLTGPQNLAVELGRKQSVTRSLRPGVYYYRAASTGMKTVKGMRRLLAGRKATWAWGRRS